MAEFYILAGTASESRTPADVLVRRDNLVVGGKPFAHWQMADGGIGFCFGRPIGWRDGSGRLQPIAALRPFLAELTATEPFERWPQALEGHFLLLVVKADGQVLLQRDRFAKIDVFVQSPRDGGIALAGTLDRLPDSPSSQGYDQAALAHSLSYYGHRPPKKHTLYKGVRRLGVGEAAKISNGQMEVVTTPLATVAVRPYGERELEQYSEAMMDHVSTAASRDGNVVFLSSGWDSTSILALLVHGAGPKAVRGVIGRMTYSDRSGVCNQFEIDRARKFADYYGIHLDVVDLNHKENGRNWVERVQPIFLRNQFHSITGLNHYILANKAHETARGDETVFVGEISDGAHNLGFSQYATLFHPSHDFRQYADKMLGYLFGPTFVHQVLNNRQDDDAIFSFFKSRSGATLFDAPASTAGGRKRQMLTSFFLRNGRMPFWSARNSRLLTPDGAALYTEEMENTYFTGIEDAAPDEFYSWYLNLYNSFHWQGSTVMTAPTMVEHFGMNASLPYWDAKVQEILCAMPEQFGRGLDFNQTKYPLKWMLKNKVKYPLEFQEGPHSYTYDVDPTFNHNFELYYHSTIGNCARECLRSKPYRNILSEEMFDLAYIDGLVDGYLNGEEYKGGSLHDLVSIALLCQTSWY